MTDQEIYKKLEEIFNENYEVMQITSGSYLSEDIKKAADIIDDVFN